MRAATKGNMGVCIVAERAPAAVEYEDVSSGAGMDASHQLTLPLAEGSTRAATHTSATWVRRMEPARWGEEAHRGRHESQVGRHQKHMHASAACVRKMEPAGRAAAPQRLLAGWRAAAMHTMPARGTCAGKTPLQATATSHAIICCRNTFCCTGRSHTKPNAHRTT